MMATREIRVGMQGIRVGENAGNQGGHLTIKARSFYRTTG